MRKRCRSFPINHAGGGGSPVPPVEARVHEFQVNNQQAILGSILLGAQALVFGFHTATIGGGSWTDSTGAATAPTPAANWIVAGSSDSVTAGMDGVDRWVTSANIVWASAANPHAWMVYDLPNGSQILLECNATSATVLRVVLSPSGSFAGGDVTTRPTAADENVVLNNLNFGNNNAAASTWHFIRSVDGERVYFIQCRTGVGKFIWVFAVPDDPVSGWPIPIVAGLAGSNTTDAATGLTAVLIYNAAFMRGLGASNMDLAPAIPANTAGRLPFVAASAVANSLSSLFPIYSWGLISTTAANVGLHGWLDDIWAGNQSLVDGSWYGANAADRAYVQFGVVVVPWNQSLPDLSGGAPAYLGDVQIYGVTIGRTI